jgi:hypothetical protein
MAKQTTKTKPKPAAKAPPQGDMIEFFPDVVQGTEEWFALRRGILTASNFKIIMRDGKDGEESKTREKLLYTIAGEKLTGKTEETFRSEAMRRGTEMEPTALAYYARTTFGAEVKKVGFIRRTIVTPLGRKIVVGASPDAQVGPRKGLEIKTMKPDLLIAQMKRMTYPGEHRAQVHGTMFCADWDEMDVLLFHDGMPYAPKYGIHRDEAFVRQIVQEIERFDYDLEVLMKDLQKMGGAP